MSDDSTPSSVNSVEAIGPVLGRIPSGLSILTARDGQVQETGMLASWVQQASFDPPVITVAVQKKRYLNDWLIEGTHVAVCLLGESNGSYLKHFGKGFEPGEPAFDGLDIARSSAGLPVLTDTLGYLEGRISGKMEPGDHIVYSVELTAASIGPLLESEKPFVHIRKNGLGY
jgi:flavin reductase (DIM6/NTAB) family NADH-FMN oxidoreductase RutF